MKYIRKGVGHHPQLQNAALNPPNSSAEASARWNSLKDKKGLLSILLREQYHLCGYSEYDCSPIGFHIEHVENKSQNPQGTFEFCNLLASAFHSDALARIPAKDLFGGHSVGKSTSVDMTRFVSPLDAGCWHYFVYLQSGRVIPNPRIGEQSRDKASYTIDLLNLNSAFLVSKRRAHWTSLAAEFDEHVEQGWSIRYLVEAYLVPTNSRLFPFFSVTRQFFGTVAEQVIAEA